MSATRRELLDRVRLGLTVLPGLALAPRSLLTSLLFEPDGELVPAKLVPPNPFMRDGRSLVALVHGYDPAAMVRQGLELLGGIDRLGMADKRVVIKPNIVNNRPPPSTASPQVVAAVARVVHEAGAREVIVAESSGMVRFPTRGNLEATGIRQATESAGARVLFLEEEPWVRVEPKAAKALSKFYISRPVYEADVLINLPVVKTHRFAHYSCSLKNVVGITHPRYRPTLSFLTGDWHERIAELNLAVHPILTIADATTAMIAGGPTSGTPAQTDLLFMSGDRIALDVAALALIRSFGRWDKVAGRSVWDQRQIKRAIELELGAGRPEQVEVLARSLDGENRAFERLVAAIRADVAHA
jgi:uncharacterized protein (DUF362 family)